MFPTLVEQTNIWDCNESSWLNRDLTQTRNFWVKRSDTNKSTWSLITQRVGEAIIIINNIKRHKIDSAISYHRRQSVKKMDNGENNRLHWAITWYACRYRRIHYSAIDLGQCLVSWPHQPATCNQNPQPKYQIPAQIHAWAVRDNNCWLFRISSK